MSLNINLKLIKKTNKYRIKYYFFILSIHKVLERYWISCTASNELLVI
jgi:hypothetical protein